MKEETKKLAGVPASPGFAVGKAIVYLDNDFPEVERNILCKDTIESELGRLDAAYMAAGEELKAIHEKAMRETGKAEAGIFAAHIMMLEDPEVTEQIRDRIKMTLENAEWVVFETYRSLSLGMLASGDPVFCERAADIDDVAKRLLNQLLQTKKKSLAEPDKDTIIIAHNLSPSEILTMNKAHVKGFVLGEGGFTSHIAILARAFNIPAVLGLSVGIKEINNDDELIIDGAKGEVIINPGQNEIKKYYDMNTQFLQSQNENDKLKNLPAETKDGCNVVLKANIEIPDEAEAVLNHGAMGIGLYRSEFLFLSAGKPPGEEQQFQAYNKVLKAMGDKPVTIRTVDIGADKALGGFDAGQEKNPLLGCRAIRFSLAEPELFKTQLRALLRASVNGNVRVMFPMISGIEELEKALVLLEEAKSECKMKGQPFKEKIETGIMIEIPSAAMIADILAEKSTFFSIGTNDLVQYSLAADRENEKVNYLAEPLHPAVIRFLKMTIDAAHNAGIKAAMCGEMAGAPEFTALLLGLGLDEFSMTSSSIPAVKKTIRELSMKDCISLASEILSGKSAEMNIALNKAWMKERGLTFRGQK